MAESPLPVQPSRSEPPTPVAPPVLRRGLIPASDRVSLLCMLIDSGGRIRWRNAAAARIWPAADPSTELVALVHPGHRSAVAGLLGRACVSGRADGTVRLVDSGAPPQPRYVHLEVVEAGDAWASTGEELLINGWDVTALITRIHELELHAFRDPLTGLANRLTFGARLDQEISRSCRSGRNVAVLFADVDGFKHVNDSHGHAAGDRLLVALADRLGRTLRPGDTLARVGGDEFAMICSDLVDPAQALAIVDRLRVAAAEPVPLGNGVDVSVTLSVGLAFAADGDRDDAGTELLARADRAMYREKQLRDAFG